MKIIAVHNSYREPGGEDAVVLSETALLKAHGHTVLRYSADNADLDNYQRWDLATKTVWNGEQYQQLRSLFAQEKPEVVHVHNTLPLISPAVYYAAHREGATVVQTLHNYRLVCPSGILFRAGRTCELCIGKAVPWPGIVHACYRNDRPATMAVASMLAYHRARRTYARMVDRYIALTSFARERFIAGGLAPERVVIKPNFLMEDPGPGTGSGGQALFVGRLSEEKGVRVLLDAWKIVGNRVKLRIAGDGPLMREAQRMASGLESIAILGRLSKQAVLEEMKRASMVIIPSVWYEAFPVTLVESLAVGTPVLVSRLGSLEVIARDGATGLFFSEGDPHDLASKVEYLASNREELRRMRISARDEYLHRYTAEENYKCLMVIYEEARTARKSIAK